MDSVSQKAVAAKVSQQPQWLRLLHYRREFPVSGSQADGRGFFISPDGDHSPEHELQADIAAFCAGTVRPTGDAHLPNLPARCQFPMREKFLLRELGLTEMPWPKPACPDLEAWRERLRPASLTLIFASYFSANPGSVFGHTLLRLNREKTPGLPISSPLLSYGINFAASAGKSNPLTYALLGLAGGFPGTFSALPYYYKVREYSDAESRDLWEYDLNLSSSELHDFVDHMWELGFTYFNYYYFTENCSYHLMTALEGAVPRINPSAQLPWWVIPVDSVRAMVNTPGLVQSVRFRPSLYRKYRERAKDLNPPATAYFNQITEKQDMRAPAGLAPEDQARAVDAALDFWDFRHFRDLVEENAGAQTFKHKLLLQRASLPTVDSGASLAGEDRPDQGHGSMRYGLGFGHTDQRGGFADLDVRFALHDWLDPLPGYPPTSTIEFFHFRGRGYDNLRKPELQEFRFVNVALHAPLNSTRGPVSWRFALGGSRVQGYGCQDCFAPLAITQGGLSVEWAGRTFLSYALLGARAQWEVGPQATVGTRIRINDHFLSVIEGEWTKPLGPHQRDLRHLSWETRFGASTAWSVGLNFMNDERNDKQVILNLYHYR